MQSELKIIILDMTIDMIEGHYRLENHNFTSVCSGNLLIGIYQKRIKCFHNQKSIAVICSENYYKRTTQWPIQTKTLQP